MKPSTDILDDMIKKLNQNLEDYVFVMHTETLKDIGDSYKGFLVRRFTLIKEDSVYLMHDPIFND